MAGKVYSVLSSVRHYIFTFLNLIFSLLLAVLVAPFVLILWLLNEFVRLLIITPLLKISGPGKFELVQDGADNVWSFHKTGNSRNILILTVYADVIDIDKYKRNFRERVLNFVDKNGKRPYEKLKKIYTQKFGYNCWEKRRDFNLENHIKVLNSLEDTTVKKCSSATNNSNGNGGSCLPMEIVDSSSVAYFNTPIMTESEVLKTLGQLTPDMEESAPQWEELIIPRFVYDHEVESYNRFETTTTDRENSNLEMKLKPTMVLKPDHKIRTARIFRCNHAYMDGASYLLLTSNCMNDGDFPYVADPLSASKMTTRRIIVHLASCIAFAVTTILKTIIVAGTAKNRFVTRKFNGKAYHTWSPQIKLDVLAEIRKSTKSSLPTILASVTAGAIRKLDERYPASRKTKTNKSTCSILCCKRSTTTTTDSDDAKVMPINDNETGSDKKCCTPDKVLIGMIGAVCPYPDVSPRNRYTVVNFFATTTATTRLKRLQLMKELMIKLGGNQDFLVNLWMFQFFGKFPHFLVQSLMKNAGSPVVLSNTPWARSRVTLMGDEVEELGGWIPLLTFSGVGLLITRYCDTVRFCAVAEDACLSEEQLHFLVAEIQNEIYLLAQECVTMQNSLTPGPANICV